MIISFQVVILLITLIMYTAIQFDDKSFLDATKISNVVVNWFLTTEFYPKLLVAQGAPQY